MINTLELSNMTDSVVSSFSMVSINDEEMSADMALDESCARIQTGVNELHSIARQLLMADERSDTYEEMEPLFTGLKELVKEGCDLFKELQSICRQMMPPKPRKPKKKTEEKEAFATSH